MRRRRRAARDQSASGSRGGAEGPRGGAEGPLRGPRAAGLAPPPGAGNRKHVGLRTQSQSQLTVQGSTPRVEKGMERKQKDLLKKIEAVSPKTVAKDHKGWEKCGLLGGR